MAHPADDAFTAVVLAADRTRSDPVALAAAVPCKALAPVGGRPMVLRVLDALRAARDVERCVLCGPDRQIVDLEPRLREQFDSAELRWVAPQATPSLSALSTLQSIPERTPVLLTTGDHALLSARVVDHFTREACATGCDVVAALARHADTMAAFPGMRRTRTRFQDGAVCGCNLYAFMTTRGRTAADVWRRVEHERKRPLKMLAELGWMTVLRYLTGRLTLENALQRVSRAMGLKVAAVMLPFPEAAVDVDTVEDWRMAQDIAARLDTGEKASSQPVRSGSSGPGTNPPPAGSRT
jgi:CTP:molybdopterin cytidylyltransferase MocA